MKTIKYDDRVETLNDKGQIHSFNDKPAIEYDNGDKFWYKKDKIHRIDRPAIEFDNGDKFWYKEGKRHRLDGPAEDYEDRSKMWYKEGKYHRLDGPAIEWYNGSKWIIEWYYEGKEMECSSLKEFLKMINLKAFW